MNSPEAPAAAAGYTVEHEPFYLPVADEMLLEFEPVEFAIGGFRGTRDVGFIHEHKDSQDSRWIRR